MTDRGSGRWNGAVVVLLMVTALAACRSDPPDGRQAEVAVTAWLEAAAGGSQDRGWHWLDASARDAVSGGDLATYAADVAVVDWAAFRWMVAAGTFWDGVWRVTLHTPGGIDAVPAFILDAPLAVRACSDTTIVGVEFYVVIDELGDARLSTPARTGSAERLECP